MMKEIEVGSAAQLISAFNELPNNFIFRGHADSSWPLASTLERVVGNRWSADHAKKFEEFSLTEFRPKFHLYDRENVQPKSKLAWLSIMQHYGVPTRLLDFTESPFVALYFALESYDPQSHTDLAVFAIDYSATMDNSLEHIALRDADFRETRATVHDKQDFVFDTIVDHLNYDVAWIAEPNQLNARLDRQAGSFLLSGNRGNRIQDVLISQTYSGVRMFKFRISYTLYSSLFGLLRKMNITSKSLYGDLGGLARSIRMQMQYFAA
jgi:hypothetical protein